MNEDADVRVLGDNIVDGVPEILPQLVALALDEDAAGDAPVEDAANALDEAGGHNIAAPEVAVVLVEEEGDGVEDGGEGVEPAAPVLGVAPVEPVAPALGGAGAPILVAPAAPALPVAHGGAGGGGAAGEVVQADLYRSRSITEDVLVFNDDGLDCAFFTADQVAEEEGVVDIPDDPNPRRDDEIFEQEFQAGEEGGRIGPKIKRFGINPNMFEDIVDNEGLSRVETDVLTMAMAYLEEQDGEFYHGTRLVLVDLFVRINNVIRSVGGFPESHTLVIWRTPQGDYIFDHNNSRLPQFAADTFGHGLIARLGQAPKIEFYKLGQRAKPFARDADGHGTEVYRDCIDISAKMSIVIKEHSVRAIEDNNLAIIQTLNMAKVHNGSEPPAKKFRNIHGALTWFNSWNVFPGIDLGFGQYLGDD